jgi:hypothetical protein
MPPQRLASAAATPSPIPMPAAHAPVDQSTRQITVRPESHPFESRPSHSSNPHRSQRQTRPFRPAISCLGAPRTPVAAARGSLVMQASDKPAQEGSFADERDELRTIVVGRRCVRVQELHNTRSRQENQAIPGVFAPLAAGRRSVALDYSAAFFAAALRVPAFFRAGAFVPTLRPRPSDFASSERFAA